MTDRPPTPEELQAAYRPPDPAPSQTNYEAPPAAPTGGTLQAGAQQVDLEEIERRIAARYEEQQRQLQDRVQQLEQQRARDQEAARRGPGQQAAPVHKCPDHGAEDLRVMLPANAIVDPSNPDNNPRPFLVCVADGCTHRLGADDYAERLQAGALDA